MDKLEKLLLTLEKKEVNENDRVITFIGSTPNLDRDKDIIPINEWNLDNYKKNPVFLWAHNYSELPVGKTLDVWVQDDKLMFKVQFATAKENPKAENVYNLYKGGYLNATSVGFNGNWKYDDQTKIGTWSNVELYELSAVPVPANPDALVYMRSIGDKGLKDIANQCEKFDKTKCEFKNDKKDIEKDDVKNELNENIKKLEKENKELQEKIKELETKLKEFEDNKKEQDDIIKLIDDYKKSVISLKDNNNNDLKKMIDEFKNIYKEN